MARKDITLNASLIGEISIGHERSIDIELSDVDSDNVVSEFGHEDLLDSMDIDEIKSWLERKAT